MARKARSAAAKATLAASAATTDYARVREILDAAAGDSESTYGGIGRFWNLDLPTFKDARVYDVRMIAPEPAASCCCDGESRSASSGLIKGLRGEAPFDGSRFPPLPWGGTPVAAADIAFIADWIDNGCPGEDELSARLEMKSRSVSRVKVAEVAEFDAFAAGARRYAYREGEPRQRANLDCLSPAQLDDLRLAFRRIYDIDEHEEDRRNYNNQALIHQNHCQHGWERFLPWHRAYLYEFEQNLQDFVPDAMLPYWDFTMPQYRPHDPAQGWRIPEALKAYLTPEQAEWLISQLKPRPSRQQADKLRALAETRMLFTSQHDFFCYVITTIGYTDVTPSPDDPNRQRMLDALLASNALWYPLRYPGEYTNNQTINEAMQYHYPTADDMAAIRSLNNFRDFGGGNIYNASFGFLDQNPHNTMHLWTGGQNPEYKSPNSLQPAYQCGAGTAGEAAPDGEQLGERRNLMVAIRNRRFHRRSDLYTQPAFGDMFSNLTASYDPVFWPIHVNIDRVWWEWQQRNPTGVPFDLDSVLSPWSYTVRDVLDISRFGYEYVRCSFFIPVGLEAPIGRFVSKPIRVEPKAKNFRKAEIRMHWVPQLARSCFVRAFLNQPGADATTPVRGNPHYAGYLAIFGHGECYGGPGHCDLPPPRARAFDQRPRSHNTPRNHRLDVTEAARRLLEKGDELQITLLVIGVDYREDNDLLRLAGVSLNLLD
jgi:tyrosinase